MPIASEPVVWIDPLLVTSTSSPKPEAPPLPPPPTLCARMPVECAWPLASIPPELVT
jgi:hypothetical protein